MKSGGTWIFCLGTLDSVVSTETMLVSNGHGEFCMCSRSFIAKCLKCLLIFVTAGAGLFTAVAKAAPITFNTALPVSKAEIIVRELIAIGVASDDAGGLDRKMSVVAMNSVVAYGLTPDLAVFGILPFTFKELETRAGTRKADGIGDARLIARYTIYQKNGIGKTARVAPFIGVKLPTGDNERADTMGLLPPSLQPGTGSWDLFGGVIATYASVAWNFDFQASYRANTRAGGIERGDVARVDASFQYRLLPGKLSRGDKGYLYGVLETNLVHSDGMLLNGASDPNTGGTTLHLVPGIQYATRRWIAEAAVQVPVIQHLNGSALEKDFTFLAGLRLNF